MKFSKYYLRKWSLMVRARDGKVCQLCMDKFATRDLEAHHVKLKSLNPSLAYHLDNGVSLCVACHDIVHSCRHNETRMRALFYPYLRRKAVKDFNNKYQYKLDRAYDV